MGFWPLIRAAFIYPLLALCAAGLFVCFVSPPFKGSSQLYTLRDSYQLRASTFDDTSSSLCVVFHTGGGWSGQLPDSRWQE